MADQGKSKYSYRETGLSSNMEDYMETIVILASENRVVRVKDIARRLGIKMPSVSAALAKLKEMSLIEYEKYGFVELTEEGQKIADCVLKRHTCLADFFSTVLQIDCEAADGEACRVEHCLSSKTCSQLHRFLDFYKAEEAEGNDWVERMKKSLK